MHHLLMYFVFPETVTNTTDQLLSMRLMTKASCQPEIITQGQTKTLILRNSHTVAQISNRGYQTAPPVLPRGMPSWFKPGKIPTPHTPLETIFKHAAYFDESFNKPLTEDSKCWGRVVRLWFSLPADASLI